MRWEIARLNGSEPLVVRAGKRVRSAEQMLANWLGTSLRREMDKIPLWRGEDESKGHHVSIKPLADDFASQLYLPRLRDPSVLLRAITSGLEILTWDDTFAFAENFDETLKRYEGLRVAQIPNGAKTVSRHGGFKHATMGQRRRQHR